VKRWAALTVLLYLVTLIVLTLPVVWVAFGKWWLKENQGIAWHEALQWFLEWGYWVWLAVMGLGQALLLLAPVGIAQRRLAPRRPLLAPVITTGFFLANIFLGAVLALLCAIFKDKAFDAFAVVGALARTDSPQNPLTDQISKSATTTGAGSLDYVFGIIAVVALLWLAWALIFYRFAKTDDPNALVKRTMRWLLRGSILELLVAVPSHIIVRNRNDCCAPMGTFWGITTGLSIMLLCFGPGVFFLFVERCGRLRPAKPPTLQGD